MSVCILSRRFLGARRPACLTVLSVCTIMLGAIPPADIWGQELAESEDVALEIDDGLTLHMTYYAGPADKETVPILILHDWENETHADYKGLAEYLQSKGHSVVVPDLRGHGDSTIIDTPTGPEKLNLRNFDKPEYAAVLQKDLEAVRNFLLSKHIKEELNLNKLFVVGAGDGALFGLYWAMLDWARDKNWVSPFWNGQSVRGLVLISPSTDFKKLLRYQDPLSNKDIQRQPSVLIVFGKNSKLATVQANKYRTTLERFHPAPPKGQEADLQTFFFLDLETSLQGANLVAQPEFEIGERIAIFVKLRSAKMPAYKPFVPPVPGAVPAGAG